MENWHFSSFSVSVFGWLFVCGERHGKAGVGEGLRVEIGVEKEG